MADKEFKYDVFISYSHKDQEWVRNILLPTLEKQGLKVCIDYRDFIAVDVAPSKRPIPRVSWTTSHRT
jgi:hypothetical protein